MHVRCQPADIEAARAFLPAEVARLAPDRLCRKLARTHYENFTVGSALLPRSLRPHVYNVYAYCRVCDDLADETGDRELSLRLLAWWRDELEACFGGRPVHPVFHALRETVERFDLPIQPFEDLISAFEQDQRVTRYATFEELLGYCTRSANPVGRLFLCLLGYRDEARAQLADLTCTALQLANFWQDIPADYDRGRIYIPAEDMVRFGYAEAQLASHVVNAGLVRLMRFQVERTRELFERGAPLANLIDGAGAADVALFTAGGMALLAAIERSNYDVFRRRITVSAPAKALLVARWCARRILTGRT
jgi:squalene synthase HpnC